MNRIERYNKIAQKDKSKSLEIIAKLNVQKDDNILEIGVGGGYFAGLFSDIIGEKGVYYGADTENIFLENLEKINQSKKSKNIYTLKINTDELPNPQKKVNLIFTRNVYHHLSNRIEYFKKLSNFLEEDGKVAIIDYDESFTLMRLFRHYTKSKVIVSEMIQANYVLKNEYNMLKGQKFYLFERNKK